MKYIYLLLTLLLFIILIPNSFSEYFSNNEDDDSNLCKKKQIVRPQNMRQVFDTISLYKWYNQGLYSDPSHALYTNNSFAEGIGNRFNLPNPKYKTASYAEGLLKGKSKNDCSDYSNENVCHNIYGNYCRKLNVFVNGQGYINKSSTYKNPNNIGDNIVSNISNLQEKNKRKREERCRNNAELLRSTVLYLNQNREKINRYLNFIKTNPSELKKSDLRTKLGLSDDIESILQMNIGLINNCLALTGKNDTLNLNIARDVVTTPGNN